MPLAAGMHVAAEHATRRVDIIPAKRRAMILEWLRAHGAVSIHELAGELGASASTVRRDLEHLTEAGYLERTHGGAQLVPRHATFEVEPSISAHIDLPQKRAIGAEAATRVKPRDSVIFDSSSTVTEAVRLIVGRGVVFTAVTNSLDVAQLCACAPAIRVVVLGGTVRPGSPLIYGEPASDFLRTIHADLCMIGTYSISGRSFTDASLEVASIKRAIIRASRRRIVLADSSKFRQPSFSTFCDVAEIEEVITDDGAPSEQVEALRALGTKVTVVRMQADEARA